jgi:flagellar biosynthetic protein FliQ
MNLVLAVTDTSVVQIAVADMIICAKLCGPILLVSLAIGLAVSLFQSVTQIQEVTLTFVPKLVGVGLVLTIGGHWMLAEMMGFTRHLFDLVPSLVAGA